MKTKQDGETDMYPMPFREKLRSGRFIVTGEMTPPKGTDTKTALENAELIRGLTDAVNVTDSQCAVMHMSSLSFSHLLAMKGFNVIMQMTCRDRNRIALQGDLLGAAALNVRNVLVMTGDHPIVGNHPGAKPVYDLDPVQVLETVQTMRNGYDMSGAPLDGEFDICAGCVSNIDPENKMQLLKLRKKINAGAEFIQTQAIFDTDLYDAYRETLSDQGIDIPVIGGIVPLRSAGMASYMNTSIPGITIPDEMMQRIKNADDPAAEGIEIASEIIRHLKKKGDGVHMMPIGSHENTPLILKKAGSV